MNIDRDNFRCIIIKADGDSLYCKITIGSKSFNEHIESYISKSNVDVSWLERACKTDFGIISRFANGNRAQHILIYPQDEFINFNIEESLAFHKNSGATITLITSRNQSNIKTTDLENFITSDANGKVTGYFNNLPLDEGEKANLPVMTGAFIITPNNFLLTELSKKSHFQQHLNIYNFIENVDFLKAHNVYCYETEKYCMKINDFSDVLEFQQAYFTNQTGLNLDDFASSHIPISGDFTIVEPSYLGENITIGKGAVVGPYATVGDGSYVGQCANITNSIISPFAYVGEFCSISNSLVSDNSTIKQGATIEHSLLCENIVVNDYSTIKNSSFYENVPIGSYSLYNDFTALKADLSQQFSAYNLLNINTSVFF